MGLLVTWEYTVETRVLADEDKRDTATTLMVKMVFSSQNKASMKVLHLNFFTQVEENKSFH